MGLSGHGFVVPDSASYRREIYVSTDRRANPKTIKIENSVGTLQVWQATPGELESGPLPANEEAR
jgi:hypothetical protein